MIRFVLKCFVLLVIFVCAFWISGSKAVKGYALQYVQQAGESLASSGADPKSFQVRLISTAKEILSDDNAAADGSEVLDGRQKPSGSMTDMFFDDAGKITVPAFVSDITEPYLGESDKSKSAKPIEYGPAVKMNPFSK